MRCVGPYAFAPHGSTTSDEGVDALMEFVPRLVRVDVRHCPAVAQAQPSQNAPDEGLDPRRIWRHGRFENR
jgi:hypothetical protein